MSQIPTSSKKIFCLMLVASFIVSVSFAQNLRPSSVSGQLRSLDMSHQQTGIEAESDTLVPPGLALPCGDTVTVYYPTNSWGYISGTNNYGDKQKAQKFTISGFSNTFIDEAWVFFADKSGPGTATLKINIYAAGTTGSPGSPGSLLGSSTPKPASQIQLSPTSVVPTIFPFTQPAALTSGSFYVSVDLTDAYANNDTIGIFTTRNGCGTDAWEQFSDNSWFAMSDGTSSWGLNLNLYILAVARITTGIDQPVGWDGISLEGIQVGDETATLAYSQSVSEPVDMAIYSVTGQRLATWTETPGAAQSHFDHASLPSGIYVWTVATSQGQIGLKWKK